MDQLPRNEVIGWDTSHKMYWEQQAEKDAEIAEDTREVEGEVFVFEVRQAALRELERVVSTLRYSTYVMSMLTMLHRMTLTLLVLTLAAVPTKKKRSCLRKRRLTLKRVM